MKIHWGFEPP